MSSRDVDRSLELAREVFAPSAQHRERVLARLVTQGVPGSAAAGSAPSTAAARAPRWIGRGWLGVARAGLFVGAGFALGYWFAETRAPQQPTAWESAPVRDATATNGLGADTRLAPPPTPNAGAAARSSVAPLEAAAPKVPTVTASNAAPARAVPGQARAHGVRAARTPNTEAPGVDAERFAEELVLLQRAERAIRAGNGPLARSFIADLEARFPRTALRQERAAVLVLAACAALEPGAADAARAFVARNPNSVYLDRIQDACALEPSAGAARRAPADMTRDTPDTLPPDGSPSHGH
jgi:hypothetical protein